MTAIQNNMIGTLIDVVPYVGSIHSSAVSHIILYHSPHSIENRVAYM